MSRQGTQYDIQTSVSQKNNEILELIYMGKVSIDKERSAESQSPTNKAKSARQFLVRRIRSLEVMFTNGLTHWVEPIPNSEVEYPFVISDVILGNDNKRLIVYNSVKGVDTQVQIKVFHQEGNNFQMNLENTLQTLEKKNVSIDKFGDLIDIQIQMYSSQQQAIFIDKRGNKLIIKIPSSLFEEELFEKNNKFERIILSDDNRFIMCGHVMLKLSENSESVEKVGCISYRKNHSVNEYKFNNLMDLGDRKYVKGILKHKDKNLVLFKLGAPPL